MILRCRLTIHEFCLSWPSRLAIHPGLVPPTDSPISLWRSLRPLIPNPMVESSSSSKRLDALQTGHFTGNCETCVVGSGGEPVRSLWRRAILPILTSKKPVSGWRPTRVPGGARGVVKISRPVIWSHPIFLPSRAQKLARHRDPKLTANIYTKMGVDELADAVAKLPGFKDTGS